METYAIERVIEDSRVFLNVMTDDAIDELASLKADWLADKDNKIGNVSLPTAIVERTLMLRDSIDLAMQMTN